MIVRVTRLLLSLVIALSVTMILYNGMMYIIQTWQWKEGKNLAKNIVYIVVWILLSLFSVIIITVLQSISPTLESEIKPDVDNQIDEELIDWSPVWLKWSDIIRKL